MKTNVFLNHYTQPENKLTYNFLSLVELLNDTKFCTFLTGLDLAENPVTKINLVYGGGKSNPDGCISLKRTDGKISNIYLENKTWRLGLTANQLISHLELCKEDDLLLVITPRVLDEAIITSINNPKIKFKTWQDISGHLSKYDSPLAKQFVEYGKISGEFDIMGELTSEDIQIYSKAIKIEFDKKIEYILTKLMNILDLSLFGFNIITKKKQNSWGRNSIELYSTLTNKSYNQWFSIAYYYNTQDHGIRFKNEIPEIAVFFDIDPVKKRLLQDDYDFRELVDRLLMIGFESNLDNTCNHWRLLFYRKSINEFDILNVPQIQLFVEEVFKKLLDAGCMEHQYFKELSIKNETVD